MNKSCENKNRIRVILLSDDKQNLEKAHAEGILCSTVGDYVRGLNKLPTLQDKLASKGFTSQDNKAAIFPPHLTLTETHEGIKSGKLLQGSFAASRENYLEGFVNVEGIEKSVSTLTLTIIILLVLHRSFLLIIRFCCKAMKV